MFKFTLTKMTFFAAGIPPAVTTLLSAQRENEFNKNLQTQLRSNEITPDQANKIVTERGEQWQDASMKSSI